MGNPGSAPEEVETTRRYEIEYYLDQPKQGRQAHFRLESKYRRRLCIFPTQDGAVLILLPVWRDDFTLVQANWLKVHIVLLPIVPPRPFNQDICPDMLKLIFVSLRYVHTA